MQTLRSLPGLRRESPPSPSGSQSNTQDIRSSRRGTNHRGPDSRPTWPAPLLGEVSTSSLLPDGRARPSPDQVRPSGSLCSFTHQVEPRPRNFQKSNWARKCIQYFRVQITKDSEKRMIIILRKIDKKEGHRGWKNRELQDKTVIYMIISNELSRTKR